MKRLRRILPDSLAGQAILVLLVGLSVSHVISMSVYSSDRVEALTAMGGWAMAQRAANITHLVVEAPLTWRQKLVTGLDEPGFRVSIEADPPPFSVPGSMAEGWRTDMVQRYVASLMPVEGVASVRVHVIEDPPTDAGPGSGWMSMRMMMGDAPLRHRLQVAVHLVDGPWLAFDGAIPDPDSPWSWDAIFSMLLMAIAVVAFTTWVVRRLTRPLRSLAHAAERLGRDVTAEGMAETGPREVRQAAHAFNRMRERLRRLIESRTRMLAAISHDLRTPITLLRLRTEALEDGEDRERMLATLDDMERMIATTLAFARQDEEREEMRRVDLSALVQSLCDDFTDMGQPVRFTTPGKVLVDCRPVGVRRTVTNLVENALKYGGDAALSLREDASTVSVLVEDNGPGIPAEELDRVFLPFFRVEESRNRETGGTGLGLSIAQGIAQAHGGDITLENKNQGLRATLVLPR
jgi:signal transduction histidine kinase